MDTVNLCVPDKLIRDSSIMQWPVIQTGVPAVLLPYTNFCFLYFLVRSLFFVGCNLTYFSQFIYFIVYFHLFYSFCIS
jgi:hypothetical protein